MEPHRKQLTSLTSTRKDPSKIQPITALYRSPAALANYFTSILNTRLMHFMQEANISHPFQGAFSKGKQGTDHIFVANTLIDQAKHLNTPLYAAFMDLQKAYDSVNQPLLLRKMVMCGLDPQFCQQVEHMFVQATSCIKVGAKLGQSFTTNVGLHQGDPLSPLLFNLFTFKTVTHLPYTTYLYLPSTFHRGRVVTRWPGSQEVGGSIPGCATKFVRCKNLAFNIGECVSRGSDTT